MNTDKKKYDWNPQLYLKYKNERTQPSIDLVSRIDAENPEKIIDIGCGPGNSTRVLAQRWPESIITGLDNSPAMIEKAGMDYPDQEWILSDISGFETDIKYDIVFSNAAIQWIPGHENLLLKLFSFLSTGGALAIQIPQFNEMPLGKSLEKISGKIKWKELTHGCRELFTYHESGYYYDILAQSSNSIEMWETSYCHVMDSHESILEWIRSTGLKPYIDRMKDDFMKSEFEYEVLESIRQDYPEQKNGKVLFPFKRLFFIAYN